MTVLEPREYLRLMQLYTEYALVVDSNDWDRWPEFFVEHGIYKLQPRENHEQGLPLCLLSLESKAMLRDRVYGVKETMYHDPYYQRHLVGMPRVTAVEEAGRRIVSEANYAVIRTKYDQASTVFNAGCYRDVVVDTEGGLKFELRLCVYDTEMIPNSVIYPI
jgi:salicylate 5-hydroxylase small subunit